MAAIVDLTCARERERERNKKKCCILAQVLAPLWGLFPLGVQGEEHSQLTSSLLEGSWGILPSGCLSHPSAGAQLKRKGLVSLVAG